MRMILARGGFLVRISWKKLSILPGSPSTSMSTPELVFAMYPPSLFFWARW